MSSFSAFWGPENAIPAVMKHMVQFLAGHETHGSWVQSILELIFCSLEA